MAKETSKHYLSKLWELVAPYLPDKIKVQFQTVARSYAGGKQRGENAQVAKKEAAVQAAYDSLDALPEAVRNALPEDAQRIWMAAFNNTIASNPKDEPRAHRIAWGAVKRAGWHQDEAGAWQRPKAAGELMLEARLEAMEASEMSGYRFTSEIELSEDKRTGTVQIFPPVGKYNHPRYGELNISPEFLDRVKANFEAKVYQQDLPLTVDLEHESKLSGAAGWIKDIEVRGDKGMWATIEFNDRGKSLVDGDSYRYFSPEFYSKWQDPATSKDYTNLLIGGALTNRPFFKGMDAVLIANEAVYLFSEIAGQEGDGEDMVICEQCGKMIAEDSEKCPECGAMMSEPDVGDMHTNKPIDKMMADKTEDGESYPREAFLYAPDKPSDWKLRIWESPTAKVTRAQLGRAAAAFSPGGFRGQKVQIPPEDRPGILAKLRALYAKLGAKPDEIPAQVKGSMIDLGVGASDADAVLTEMGYTQNGGEAMGMTDDEARRLTEMETAVKSLSEGKAEVERQLTEARAETKRATDEVERIKREDQRRQFTEFVRANRLAFQGEVDGNVDRLERMRAALSDEDWAAMLDEKRTLNERLRQSGLFTRESVPGPVNGADNPFEAAVAKVMSEDPKLNEAQAQAKVAGEQPALYAAYDKAQKRHARTGGD